jgi:hypothetical protein
MIAYPQSQLMTPLEYLEWEEQQPIKYEYIDGQIVCFVHCPDDYLRTWLSRTCGEKLHFW